MIKKQSHFNNFDHLKDFLNTKKLLKLEEAFENKKIYSSNPTKTNTYSHTDDGYLIVDTTWNLLPDKPTITYKFNSHGFRSPHFKNLNNDKINILYAGCSHTVGEALPIELTWPAILSEKIFQKNTNIDFYNLSFFGDGIDMSIKNIMSFIREFGKPNYIFICFPELSRSIKFDSDIDCYRKTFPGTEWFNKKNEDFQIQETISYKYENNIFIYSILIKLFEDFCKEANIKLYWQTWNFKDIELYNSLGFDNFIDIQYKSMDEIIKRKNINNLKFWDLAADKMHFGTAWTTLVAELFFEEFIK